MKIVDYAQVPDAPNPHGVSARVLLETDHVQTVMVTLESGQALKLHITPVDAFFYILEGQGTVEIGGESQVVNAGKLIVSPAGIPHRLFNSSADTFRFLVVKTPRPDRPAKIL